jgi:hypothetical protein
MNQASAPWPSHLHGCCSDLVVRERKVLRSLFLIAFLSSVFQLPSVFPGFQKQKDEKWNSMMSPLSPALPSTADVEESILEIRFIISRDLFIPLVLQSLKVPFLDPLLWKIFEKKDPFHEKGSGYRYRKQ